MASSEIESTDVLKPSVIASSDSAAEQSLRSIKEDVPTRQDHPCSIEVAQPHKTAADSRSQRLQRHFESPEPYPQRTPRKQRQRSLDSQKSTNSVSGFFNSHILSSLPTQEPQRSNVAVFPFGRTTLFSEVLDSAGQQISFVISAQKIIAGRIDEIEGLKATYRRNYVHVTNCHYCLLSSSDTRTGGLYLVREGTHKRAAISSFAVSLTARSTTEPGAQIKMEMKNKARQPVGIATYKLLVPHECSQLDAKLDTVHSLDTDRFPLSTGQALGVGDSEHCWLRMNYARATNANGERRFEQELFYLVVELSAHIECSDMANAQWVVVASCSTEPFIVFGRSPRGLKERRDKEGIGGRASLGKSKRKRSISQRKGADVASKQDLEIVSNAQLPRDKRSIASWKPHDQDILSHILQPRAREEPNREETESVLSQSLEPYGQLYSDTDRLQNFGSSAHQRSARLDRGAQAYPDFNSLVAHDTFQATNSRKSNVQRSRIIAELEEVDAASKKRGARQSLNPYNLSSTHPEVGRYDCDQTEGHAHVTLAMLELNRSGNSEQTQ